ncbi:MAG: hypothetical protein NTZ26_12335 [Candidatus Aminicenantes bacterium]|nr:hypothetical protein [Candidatus Aminicenantes bacterium]
MFRKELADVLKQTGWFLAAAAVLPIPLILLKWAPGPYRAVFIPVFEVGLVFWSLFLGASLFGRERGQRAEEYALSLPHGRMALLVRLAGPRLLVLLVLVLAAMATIRIGIPASALLLPALAVGIGLPLFLVSLSLSVLIENFIVLCLASIVGWYAASEIIFRLLWGSGTGMVDLYVPGLFAFPRPDAIAYRGSFSFPLILLQIILPVVPFVAALLFSFGRFDIRRSARFKRRFGFAFAAGLALCVLTAVGGRALTNSFAQKHFYLTKSLKLVEYDYVSRSAKIRSEEAPVKIRVGLPGLAFGWDDGSSLFVEDYNGDFNRIDLATGKAESLYHFDLKQTSYWGQWMYAQTIAFFENGSRPGEVQLLTLDAGTKKVNRRVFAHAALGRGNPMLIGTGVHNGVRFWICTIPAKALRSTLRLWEDGRVEEILVKGRLETPNIPSLVNGLLFFTGREPTLILRDNGKGFELLKEFSSAKDFSAMDGLFNRRELDAAPISFIYAKRGRQLVRLSLETLEVEDIGTWTENEDDAWGFIIREGGRAYFVGGSRSKKNLDFYDLNEGRMRLVRSFSDINTQRRDTRFDYFESGVVITQGRHIGVYAFPDLREIKYK